MWLLVVCSIGRSTWHFLFVISNFWGTEVSIFPEAHLANGFKESVYVCACVHTPAACLVLTAQRGEFVRSLTNIYEAHTMCQVLC